MKKPPSIVTMTCVHCGTTRETPTRRQRYCSTECATEAKADKYRAEINKLMAEGQIPTTRLEASFLGAKYYFTGKPCRNGHIDIHIANTSKCFICTRIKKRKDSEKRRLAGSKKSVTVVSESVQTNTTWLHILPDWSPVVVARGMV
mgnify:CR=1 FL=1